ncbi:hypothetical protein P9112_011475 [Eukaryota sp. TZLM1-RC]
MGNRSRNRDVVRAKNDKKFPPTSVPDFLADIENIGDQTSESYQTELSKQGYYVIPPHSAVKLCSWSKRSLRNDPVPVLDGDTTSLCYKHDFYGIDTAFCIQSTVSLSCANRCIFCWRHQQAPLAEDWKWKAAPPVELCEALVLGQQKLVKEHRGVPNVDLDLVEKALTPKHVALSLVGEPILYPHFDELLEQFHRRRISTFVVCNGQNPSRLGKISLATQVYVSVDAPNPELLKQIDRPMSKDYWQRLLDSLTVLSTLKARTCIRLTAIKGVNTLPEHIDGFMQLIRRGSPLFIEVKGYTHVGGASTTGRNILSMSSMPFPEDTLEFARLVEEASNGDYSIISTHLPSRAVCLAHKSLFIDGEWKTWIDFDRFFEISSDPTFISSASHFGIEFSTTTPPSMLWDRDDAEFKMVRRDTDLFVD